MNTTHPKRIRNLVTLIILSGALVACDRGRDDPPHQSTPPQSTPPQSMSPSDSAPPPSDIASPAVPPADTGAAPPETDTGAATADTTAVGADDEAFVSAALVSGLAEVQASRMAAERAEDPEVRAFAERLESDHARINTGLAQLASGKGVQVSEEIPAERREQLDELNNASGSDVDRIFLTHFGAAAHEDRIALYEQRLTGDADPDVREFAAEALHILQPHLETVRRLEEKAGAESGGGAS